METKKLGIAVIYGLILVLILAIATSLIFSLILKFSSMQEGSLSFAITSVSFISLFIGGFVSGGKGGQKGWLLGGGTGLLYTLFVFMFQYLGYDSLFSVEQIIYHTCYILTAMMGGILGVNMTAKTRTA